MEGNPKVIVVLNELLMAEITAINQYFVHAKMCENWGYKRLYEFNEKNSIEEMKHAEKLIERLLYLEGIPKMDIGKIVTVHPPPSGYEKNKYLLIFFSGIAAFHLLYSLSWKQP